MPNTREKPMGRMTKEVFQDWSDRVKDTVYQNIKRRMYMTGEFPAAIIAGGECQYVFMDNPGELTRTTDGMTLWLGVPLIRCGGESKVIVAWNMEEIKLPEPPKGE